MGELQQAGAVEGSSGFTLRSDKAREKLKNFALAHPENYFLLIIAALYTLGARRLELKVDADDLELVGDAALERERLTDFWQLLAESGKESTGEALRLFALAILTSSRFQSVDWELSATDSQGGFCYRQKIRKGDVSAATVTSLEYAPVGLKIKVKRRALNQVAQRFFTHLTDGFFAREGLERQIVLSRVFLGAFQTFSFNQSALPCLTSSVALGASRSGAVPHVVDAEYEIQRPGEHSVLALISSPEGVESLPGVKSRITWIWHGLCMGSSDLNLPFDFCRAFVVADRLSTDLSLTSVTETWEKGRAERAARDAMRDLMHHLTLVFLENQDRDRRESWDLRIEKLLLKVIAHRIQTSRSRQRLAKFNRDLIACPLFWGSADDGSERRYTLAELWERIETGKEIACFEPGEESANSVPACPERPLIITTQETGLVTLRSVFGAQSLLSGRAVARKVETMLGKLRRASAQPNLAAGPKIQGKLSWQGHAVTWSVYLNWPPSSPGRIEMQKDGRSFFHSAGLSLPPGLQVSGQFGWELDYRGRPPDRDAVADLLRAVFGSLADFLASRGGGYPGEEEGAAARVLWESMLGNWPTAGDEMPARLTAWVPVYLPHAGWTRTSPADLLGAHSTVPLYLWPHSDAPRFEPPLKDASYTFLTKECARVLKRYCGRPLYQGRTLQRFLALPPTTLPPNQYRIENLTWRGSAVQIAFPYRDTPTVDGVRLCINLRKKGLKERVISGLIAPVTVVMHLEEGWPNGRLDGLSDPALTSTLESELFWLVFQAVQNLMQKAGFQELARLHPQTVSQAWFECWTCQDSWRQKLFLLADGSLISRAQLSECGGGWYFTDLEDVPELKSAKLVLWVPPDVVETLELSEEFAEWTRYANESRAPDSLKKETTPLRSASPRPKPSASLASEERAVPDSSPPGGETGDPAPPLSARVPTPLLAVVETSSPEAPLTYSATGAENLLVEKLRTISWTGGEAVRSDFESYLREVTWNDQGELTASDGRIILRMPCRERRQDEEFPLLLLSALFSVFNRERGDVEDSHERQFHKALLARCEELFVKKPKSSL